MTFRVIARGQVPATPRSPAARGVLARSRPAANRLLEAWQLERAVADAGRVRYGSESLIVLVTRANDTATRLDVQRISLRGRRISALVELSPRDGAIGGQSLTRPYALVAVPRERMRSAQRTVSVRIAG